MDNNKRFSQTSRTTNSTMQENMHMSQETLAKLLGYKSKSSINKMESGINDIPQSTLKQIADILHTTPTFLIDGKTPEPAKPINLHDLLESSQVMFLAKMANRYPNKPGMKSKIILSMYYQRNPKRNETNAASRPGYNQKYGTNDPNEIASAMHISVKKVPLPDEIGGFF